MNRKIGLIGVGIVMVFSLACSLLPGGGDGKGEGGVSGPQALFQDDFSSSSSGWEVGEYDAGSVGYRDGVYVVSAIQNGSTMWGVANRSFDNIVIEVDATQAAAGPESNNDYGIVCREQEGTGDGYYLLISGDGFASIYKAADGSFENLVEWTESTAIRQGNATNHLKAVCNGSRLELFVNGTSVASTEDSTYTSGDIALTATTYEDSPTEIHFDNLAVFAP